MANKTQRCLRAEGAYSSKNKKSVSEVLAAVSHCELLDLLRAKRGGELNQVSA